jgi:hypothetical protein
MGRKREATEKESEEHPPESAGGKGMASVLGKTISTEAGRNLSCLAFFRSPSLKEEGIQPKACFFVPFFAIFDRCATLLMGMQKRGTRGLREKGERKEEEAVAAAKEQ